MLNGIHLVDFANHRDTRLTFGRMTALVGQNGAGKTNVLRGIMEVERNAFNSQNISIGGKQELARSGTAEWIISAAWGDRIWWDKKIIHEGNLAVQLGSRKFPTWLWRTETMNGERWLPNAQDDVEKIPLWIQDSKAWQQPQVVSGQINPGTVVRMLKDNSVMLWLSPYFKTAGSYLQSPSYSERPIPKLSEDCRDLAWMIAYLKGDKDEAFAAITNALREVVPTFRRVRHRPTAVRRLEKKEVVINKQPRLYDEEQTVMGQELRFDMASGEDLPASAISEGTLITLAILTAVMHDDDFISKFGIKTILLDDIESGLHPSAQRDLVKQLHRLQTTRPELQIIFSSHSPYIVDEMQPEDVWLFAPDKDGIAHCAKLSDHPDAKRALGVLTTGEFWSAEGEAWVLDPSKRAAEEPVTVAE